MTMPLFVRDIAQMIDSKLVNFCVLDRGELNMVSDNVADARFLRRVLFALVGLTLLSGILAGVTTVQAMNANPSTCVFGCQ